MESIKITNFLGIKNLSVNVSRFNIFIGEQATGKSILAKLLYHFKTFPSSIFHAVENEDDKRILDRTFLKEFCEYFPEVAWGKSAFSIEHRINDEFIIVSRQVGKKPVLVYSGFYKGLFNKLRAHYGKLQKKVSEESDDDPRRGRGRDRWANLRNLRKMHQEILLETFGPHASGFQLFIPAGRSFFANLENNIFSFLSSNNQLDPFLRAFGSFYESVKDFSDRVMYETGGEKKPALRIAIEKYTRNIIRGEYRREKRKDYIVTNDSRRVPLSTSSSGQQETLPLLIILSEFTERNITGVKQSVYIEEPEAHLFPRAQKEITDFIALTHSVNDGLQLFITTHSPYILTCLNNIIQRTESEISDKKKDPLLPRISINDVSAYALSKDGATDLIDHEAGLINATIIDEVSEELAREFESLI